MKHFITFLTALGNLVGFQYTANCKCGWQTKNARPEHAVSQAQHHLDFNNITQDDLAYPEEPEAVLPEGLDQKYYDDAAKAKEEPQKETPTKKDWKPSFGIPSLSLNKK